MAYFAQLDGNNRVTWVVVADSLEWVETNLGGWWRECYKSGDSKLVAGTNYIWSDELEGFIPPQPFASWVLDEERCRWEAPIPYPKGGEAYTWDEDAGDWIQVVSE